MKLQRQLDNVKWALSELKVIYNNETKRQNTRKSNAE